MPAGGIVSARRPRTVPKRKFYKTTFTFVVLSEIPVDGWDVGSLIVGCDTGPLVGDTTEFEMNEITGKEMADALYEARSEPGFFCLDDNGNDTLEGDDALGV